MEGMRGWCESFVVGEEEQFDGDIVVLKCLEFYYEKKFSEYIVWNEVQYDKEWISYCVECQKVLSQIGYMLFNYMDVFVGVFVCVFFFFVDFVDGFGYVKRFCMKWCLRNEIVWKW